MYEEMELATTVPNPSSLLYEHEDAEVIASHHIALLSHVL